MVYSTTCAGAVYTAGGHHHAPGLKPFRVSSERLDLSTCVCSHLVCESSDKPITCDTGLINTAVATAYDIMAPNSRPVKTHGWRMSTPVMSAWTQKAPNSARLTRAAEPIAKPFPIAAMVLSTAPSTSVRSRTHSTSCDISAMPPALSDMGPKAFPLSVCQA